MRPARLVIIVAALAAAAVPVAPATAKSTRTCTQASRARGIKVVARGPRAIVFFRERTLTYFGCLTRSRAVHRLDVCCTGASFRVNGVWAAFVGQGSAIGDESDKLGVLDLRSGRLRKIRKYRPNSEGPGRELETGSTVSSWRVTRGGAIAWIQVPLFDPNGVPELRAAGGAHPWERIVDRGALGPKSLRLDSGETRIRWTKHGVAHQAPLSEGPYLGRCGSSVRGTVVIRTPQIVIVSRPANRKEFRGTEYLGCALPNGVIHPLGGTGTTYLVDQGRRAGELTRDQVSFANPAGGFVLRETHSTSDTFEYDAGDVVALETAAVNPYFAFFDGGPVTPGSGVPIVEPASVALDPSGLVGGIYGPDPGGAPGDRVVAVTPSGAVKVLDTAGAGAFGALAVAGATVSWTRDGAQQSATVTDG